MFLLKKIVRNLVGTSAIRCMIDLFMTIRFESDGFSVDGWNRSNFPKKFFSTQFSYSNTPTERFFNTSTVVFTLLKRNWTLFLVERLWWYLLIEEFFSFSFQQLTVYFILFFLIYIVCYITLINCKILTLENIFK